MPCAPTHEADKDALLVRAALDIMAMQSRIAALEQQVEKLTGTRVQNVARWYQGRSKLTTLHAASMKHAAYVFERCGRNKVRTAKVLGISRTTLYDYLPAKRCKDELKEA